MSELEIYRQLRLNETQYITVQEFETEQEWNQYQHTQHHDVEDIEIIEDPDQHTECAIL